MDIDKILINFSRDRDLPIHESILLAEFCEHLKACWVEYDGNPWITDDYGRTTCFFCAEEEPNHTKDCCMVWKSKERN